MNVPRPFEGSLLADGLVVERRLAGPALLARVIPEVIAAGRAYHVDDGLLVVFVAPRRVRTDRLGGTPVVRRGRSLLGFAHADGAVRAHEDGMLLRLRAGSVVAEPLASLREVDPEELVVAPALRVRTMRSLGAPPIPPRLVVRDEARGLREVLAIAPDPAQASLFATSTSTSAGGKTASWKATAIATVRRWFEGALAWTRRAATSASSSRKALSSTSAETASRLALPRKPSLFERSLAWLTQRLVLLERLTGRQARYLAELLADLDDGGDLDEALRRAIPLGGAEGPGPERIALGVPSPRAELRIAPNADSPSSVLPIAPDVQSLLRERYEAAFRALERQGRHREAAFVLEELLRQHARAVDYLEKVGEIQLAAQVAEARGLAPDRVVALWFRAGDRARAIAVARRTGVMLQAIERLERIDRSLGASLRLEYAEILASAGDYLRAVEIAWPVAEARTLAKAWLARGLEAGGLAAARSWPRAFVALDPSVDEVRARLLPVLGERSIDGALFRRTFATQALGEPMSPLGYQALKLAYRGLLRDRHELGRDVDDLVRKVEEKIGDAVLVADGPSLMPRPTPVVPKGPLVLTPLESGTARAHDAVALPDGRTLVAMGELGVRLLSRTGATELVFAAPAHALVVDDRGERAIAVAGRARVMRLARLDLLARRAEPWFDVEGYAACGSFDGESLYLARFDAPKSTLVCLDALAREPSVLFCVNDLERAVVDVARDPHGLRVLVRDDEGEAELFTFDLPSRILRARRKPAEDELPSGFGNLVAPFWSPPGTLVLDADAGRALRWEESESGVVVRETRRGAVDRVVLELGGATEARLRTHGELVTVVDDRGRLVVLDHRRLSVVSATLLT